jgi:succinyl-CoA synthetase alpha subunit
MFIDLLPLFEADPQTEAIILIGEIGGDAEIKAADYISKYVTKPVCAFIAGQTAPRGKRMGHAGAIVSGGRGTAKEKMDALQDAGVAVATSPAEIASTLAKHILAFKKR